LVSLVDVGRLDTQYAGKTAYMTAQHKRGVCLEKLVHRLANTGFVGRSVVSCRIYHFGKNITLIMTFMSSALAWHDCFILLR